MGLGTILSSDAALRFNSGENSSPGFPHTCLQNGLRILVIQEKPLFKAFLLSLNKKGLSEALFGVQTWDAP